MDIQFNETMDESKLNALYTLATRLQEREDVIDLLYPTMKEGFDIKQWIIDNPTSDLIRNCTDISQMFYILRRKIQILRDENK